MTTAITFRCNRCKASEDIALPNGATNEQVADWRRYWLCTACWLGCPRQMPKPTEPIIVNGVQTKEQRV